MSVGLLRHDRLCAVGGPKHGEVLPITCGADVLMVAEPVPFDWRVPLDAPAPPYPQTSQMQTTAYRRIRITVEGNRWSCDILIADGCRLHSVTPMMLTRAIAAAVVSACQGGARVLSQHGDVPTLADCVVYEVDGVSRYGRPPDMPTTGLVWRMGREPLLSLDAWSQADEADTCWRCDAADSSTDVGLCDDCLVDLRTEVAA